MRFVVFAFSWKVIFVLSSLLVTVPTVYFYFRDIFQIFRNRFVSVVRFMMHIFCLPLPHPPPPKKKQLSVDRFFVVGKHVRGQTSARALLIRNLGACQIARRATTREPETWRPRGIWEIRGPSRNVGCGGGESTGGPFNARRQPRFSGTPALAITAMTYHGHTGRVRVCARSAPRGFSALQSSGVSGGVRSQPVISRSRGVLGPSDRVSFARARVFRFRFRSAVVSRATGGHHVWAAALLTSRKPSRSASRPTTTVRHHMCANTFYPWPPTLCTGGIVRRRTVGGVSHTCSVRANAT